MTTRRIRFRGSRGDRLAARLELPEDDRIRACALFAHCFTCSKDLRAAVTVSRTLSDEGIAVMRFDFTGLGESEGDFPDTNFSSNVEDLVHAARAVEAEVGSGPSLLVGHSLGGAAVLHARARIESVRAVATIGAPADPAHVLEHVEESREEIETRGAAVVQIGGRPFTVQRQFIEDLEATRMSRVVRSLGTALLVMHSPLDEIVGIDNAARLYDEARHPKSFVSLDDADHLLTRPDDSRYVAVVLSAWASRYVEGDTDS